MVGWYLQLNGHEFEQAPGIGDGQGGLVCCSPWAKSLSYQSSGYDLDFTITMDSRELQETESRQKPSFCCSGSCRKSDGYVYCGQTPCASAQVTQVVKNLPASAGDIRDMG